MALLVFAPPATASETQSPRAEVELTSAQLFAYADACRDAGRLELAEQAYRALSSDRNGDVRAEAHFRLALLLADRMQRYREAAIELRRILDEKPAAARVRLELARVQARLGNIGAAQRELRAAEAAGLPPEVERAVRFYAVALRAAKPSGGSIEAALAPDSNINRSTRSETLGTTVGTFALDANARARAGLGLALKGQAYARLRSGERSNLFARADASASLYRDARFNDVIVGFQAGPEWWSGTDRLNLTAGPSWRWYGTDPYSASFGSEATITHPLGRRAQARTAFALSHSANRRNALQTGTSAALAVSVDRAFTARTGGGITLNLARMLARDPGWSTASGEMDAYGFREFGPVTAVLSVGYSRLEADKRLLLFPRRRADSRMTASAAMTWRALQWHGIAPLTRVRWERSRSTVELYSFDRIAAELGIGSAF